MRDYWDGRLNAAYGQSRLAKAEAIDAEMAEIWAPLCPARPTRCARCSAQWIPVPRCEPAAYRILAMGRGAPAAARRSIACMMTETR